MTAVRIIPTANGRALMDAAIRRAMQNLVDDIAADAQDKAPVETGELKASISGEVDGTSGRVSATADHAAYVELGTENMPAQPYLRPALYKKREVHS